MAIQLLPAHLSRAEIASNAYTVKLLPGVALDDVLHPIYWAHCVDKLRRYDTIRVVAHDHSFDVLLSVIAVAKGGAHVEFWPKMPASIGKIEAKVVPYIGKGPGRKLAIRVDFTPASKWRVISLDQSELVTGIESEAEANRIMHDYVARIGMVFPTDTPADEDDKTTAKKPAAKKDAA